MRNSVGRHGLQHQCDRDVTRVQPDTVATVGGTCLGASPPSPCTVTLSTSASSLGIKSGAGMYSITGLSTFYGGTLQTPPLFRIALGNSEQSDAAAPFDVNGTGTTP